MHADRSDTQNKATHTVVRRVMAIMLLLALETAAIAGQAEVRSAIDWSRFLARHDLTWQTMPKTWEEGAFLGNGLLGAMIYSDGGSDLQWDIGRSDVTDRGDRLQIGRFVLRVATPMRTDMRLDLWNAEATGTIGAGPSAVRWRSFTHAIKPVTVIEVTQGRVGPPAPIVFEHLPAIQARADYKKEAVPPDQLNPEPTAGQSGDIHWCLQPFKAGGGYVVAWGERTLPANRRAFYFTVDYAPVGEPVVAKAVSDIQRVVRADFEETVRSHRAWWHAYYPQSFLSIPDTRMESFYWIQMYKLASATRADRPAIDLMGPWFHRTPWPHLWWNLNIQLTYWPVYASNRLELGESLTRLIDSHIPNLINNVPAEWRYDSAAIGRSTPYDCVRSLKGAEGEERGDLTWALHNYWLQYRYSGDERLLRNGLYPILKRSVAYYLHLLRSGEDGKLHLPISLSPEYPKTAPDTNYDLALLRWGLITLLATNDRLGLKDSNEKSWRDTLDALTPYPVDEATGYMIGAGQPLAQSHRHFSHLLMVYPLHLANPESQADRPLIEKSLDHWINMKGALRGYSYTGSAAMSAWLRRNDDTVRLLNSFLDQHIKPNTMYLEAGPVIETPLAGAATLNEIVLQSWCTDPFGTHIRIFPAVPESWRDVTIHRMRAEGGFEVSACRRDGRTRFVQITSLAGAPCRVETGLEDPVAAGGRGYQLTTEPDRNGHRITTVDLRKGETVLLTSGRENLAPFELAIEPVAAQHGRTNLYGSPKPAAR